MASLVPFDAADYLYDEETIAEYLTAALEDANPDVFLAAVRDVAHARGMAQLAKDAYLGGENLHRLLSPGVKLHYAPCSSCFMPWVSNSRHSLSMHGSERGLSFS